MTATTAPTISVGSYAARRERRKAIAYGVFFLVVAAAILAFFVMNSTPGMESTFKLNPVTKEKIIKVPDLVLPTRAILIALAAIVGALGLYQILRGFKHVVLVLGVVSLAFVFAFLVWAVRDKSINLLGIFTFAVAAATPIAFAAMSGIMCERSGVINIAIEGMMLTASMIAVIFSSITGSLWLGLLAAVIASGILGLFLAILAIRFRVDQIIAGTAINIFALGITSFISQRFLQTNSASELGGRLPKDRHSWPVANSHPWPGFLQPNAYCLLAFHHDLCDSLHAVLHSLGPAHPGCRRAPARADTLGVNVFKIRYINVIIGGMVAGLGGAYFTIGSVGRFDKSITAGKGFIGLAAMIFGRWTPFGAYGASLIFGFSDALQAKLQVLGKTQVPIPTEWLLILPYLVTMIVLAGVVGKTVAPAADGKPYTKD